MGRQDASLTPIVQAPPISTAGASIPQAAARTSGTYNYIIAANTTLPVSISGSMFYLIVATLSVDIRPRGGAFSPYVQGTGERFNVKDAFPSLEIANNNSVPVVVSIFIGWDTFVDNRLILTTTVNPNVAFPTYPTANAANQIAFNDLTGQKFTDVNGNKWIALYRQAIIICNIDSGTTYLLQKKGSTTVNDKSIAAVYPLTSLNMPVAGDYSMATGGANINVIASEIYAAIVSQ